MGGHREEARGLGLFLKAAFPPQWSLCYQALEGTRVVPWLPVTDGGGAGTGDTPTLLRSTPCHGVGLLFSFSRPHLIPYSSFLKNWQNVMGSGERAPLVFTGRTFYWSIDLGQNGEWTREFARVGVQLESYNTLVFCPNYWIVFVWTGQSLVLRVCHCDVSHEDRHARAEGGRLGHLPMILCFQPELNRLMGLGANNLATSLPSHLVRLRAVKRNPV